MDDSSDRYLRLAQWYLIRCNELLEECCLINDALEGIIDSKPPALEEWDGKLPDYWSSGIDFPS